MEYGYELTLTDGSKVFFVEGCTCCAMSTAGLHELGCPYNKDKQYKPSSRFNPATFYEEPGNHLIPNNNQYTIETDRRFQYGMER